MGFGCRVVKRVSHQKTIAHRSGHGDSHLVTWCPLYPVNSLSPWLVAADRCPWSPSCQDSAVHMAAAVRRRLYMSAPSSTNQDRRGGGNRSPPIMKLISQTNRSKSADSVAFRGSGSGECWPGLRSLVLFSLGWAGPGQARMTTP
jgi:hypothetical protein